MKTIAKILIAVSVLTLSFQANAGRETKGSSISTNTITYNVQVHMEKSIPYVLRDVYVVISDENGRIVAPAQRLSPGTGIYSFREEGQVKGTRIARLSNGLRPFLGQFFCEPDSKTGTFLSGNTYTFNLSIFIPVLKAVNE